MEPLVEERSIGEVGVWETSRIVLTQDETYMLII